MLTGRAAGSDLTTLGGALAQWATYLQSSDRIGSARTIDAYLYGTGKLVSRLGAHVPLAGIRALEIEALLADLKAAGMSAAGRSAVYRPIRTFFRWCVKRELLTTSPADRVEAPKVRVRGIL